MIDGFLRCAGSGLPVVLAVSKTETVVERMRGMLGKRPPPPGTGLWLSPCNAVHMFFMSYSLDIIYLNRDLQIVKIVSSLEPWRLSMCPGAHSVVELAAKECERIGLVSGGNLVWSEV